MGGGAVGGSWGGGSCPQPKIELPKFGLTAIFIIFTEATNDPGLL